EELLDREPNQLSGGQQQRVALCRALVKEPELLLLDEPLSNLDARLRIETRSEIKNLQKRLGITTIYVTHDQAEAMTMAEKIALLNKGSLEQFTSPRELYESPDTLFAASFIGDPPMNIFEADLKLSSQKPFLKHSGIELPIPEVATQRVKNKDINEVMVGIRPDEVQVYRESPETEDSFLGEVFVTEPLGGDQLIDFTFGDAKFRALTSAEFTVEPGEEVWLEVKPSALHLFNKDSGESI
ncbi:MAG: ABC transporter ATP-binding protein, partial [Candidatus Bipolaricaulia bacterium]